MAEPKAIKEARAAVEAARQANIRRWPVQAIQDGTIGLNDGEYGLATSLELAHHRAFLRQIEVDGFDPEKHMGGPITKEENKAKEVAE